MDEPSSPQAKAFARILINGKTYASVDEMPPEVRRQFQEAMSKLTTDRDANGVPDIFEQPPADPSQANVMVTTQRFVVNGVAYDRLEDLPPEIREAASRALQQQSGDPAGLALGGLVLPAGAAPVPVEAPRPESGVTIHLSWPQLLALIAGLVLLVFALAWHLRRFATHG